ncbi:MAG: beta-galactosidase [Rhodospirillales bacterium]|nr:beta-galactosidase [Rhodospirillales bacterium]MDE2574032.1 beta-galactosidase [Rhodospirillales bacterium]
MRRCALALLCAMAIGTDPARAAPPPWPDFQIIMWQPQTPVQDRALRRLGVTAGMVFGLRAGAVTAARWAPAIAPLRAAGLGFYVENIATDFYAAYHRWDAAHPGQVNFDFVQLQKRHLRDPGDLSVFVRRPGLSDPAALGAIAARLRDTVRALRRHHPLFYNLGDETGIADLSAAWDFDFSSTALAAFRVWLHRHYPSLAALNAEWGTGFASWADIRPPTTTQTMAQAGENFAAWSDFKDFMDHAFAASLRAGTRAVHAADPAALSGIEGVQMPGWGGYDDMRLAGAVDVMEVYDSAQNAAILRAFNPRLVLLATSGAADAAGLHFIWHEVLHGARGLVLWNDADNIAGPDGGLLPRGRDYAASFAALRGRLGALLLASTPHVDPVAILYSPASFRVRWMLDHRALGDAWAQRGAEAENADNAERAARRAAAAGLAHLGIQPRYLSPAMLAGGALERTGVRVLLLGDALALSDGEIVAIARFKAHGGVVLAAGTPGRFDAHGRRRAAAPAGLAEPMPARLDATLAAAGIGPGFTLTGPDGAAIRDVDITVLRHGAMRVIGLQRDQAGASERLVLYLDRAAWVRDLASPGAARRRRTVALTLDGALPTILGLTAPGGAGGP